MLFGKKTNKDQPAKQAAVMVDDLGNSRRGEDLLTESLFQDTPPRAAKSSVIDGGLIIDIDAPSPSAAVSKSEPLIRPAKAKTSWFAKASKPTAKAPPVEPVPAESSSILSDEDFIIDIQAERAKPAEAKKPQIVPEPVIEPPKRKKPWFGSKPKATASPAVETRKTPTTNPAEAAKTLVIKDSKSKKPKESAKPGSKKPGTAVDPFILLEIGGARTLYWQLTAQGIETREGVPAGESAVSFTSADLRYATDETLSTSKAQTTVEEDTAEPAYLINRSKELRAIYATQQLRFAELPYRIGPGALVLDTLYALQGPASAAAIIGFQLKDAADKDAVVVLYYRAPSGELSRPQISIYPDNLEFVLSQYATANQARADSKIELYDNAALRQAAASLALYPNQSMFAGISTRAAWKYAAAASVLLAVGSVGWSVYNYQLSQKYTTELAMHKQGAKDVESRSLNLLESSSRSLARQLSLQLDAPLARSVEFWVPGSKVRLKVEGGSSDYLVRLPLSIRPAGKTQLQMTPQDVVEQLRTLPVPAGCLRKEYSFSGALNEVSLSIHCEDPSSRLARYRAH